MEKYTKTIRVSVGLSVFNEANKIRNVLSDIMNQNQQGWEFEEILIYDDGSSDNTLEEIKKTNSNLTRIVVSRERKGKTYQLSRMFKEFKGDLLVMFDGDISLLGRDVLTELVVAFQDKKVMLVGGNSRPIPPKNFFQRSVYATYSVFYKSRKYIRQGNNIFAVAGSILAIRKYLAKKINLPRIINEDTFIYLYCISKGYKFIYQDKAVALCTLPNNLTDYLKQAFRSHPQAVDVDLKKHFGSLVSQEFKRPMKFYLKSILETFVEYPLEVIFIIFVNLLCKPFYGIVSRNYKLSWFTAKSTH